MAANQGNNLKGEYASLDMVMTEPNELWDWGCISPEEAGQKLAGKPDGTFLIRRSQSKSDSYSISTIVKDKLYHFRLENMDGGFAFDKKDTPCKSIPDLLDQKAGQKVSVNGGKFAFVLRNLLTHDCDPSASDVKVPATKAPDESGKVPGAKVPDAHVPSVDFFISYCRAKDSLGRENRVRVSKFNDALRSKGYLTWFDDSEMSGDMMLKMQSGISSSRAIIVIVTKSYIEKAFRRGNIDREIKFAAKELKHLIPVVVEPALTKRSNWGQAFDFLIGSSELHYDYTDDSRLDECARQVIGAFETNKAQPPVLSSEKLDTGVVGASKLSASLENLIKELDLVGEVEDGLVALGAKNLIRLNTFVSNGNITQEKCEGKGIKHVPASLLVEGVKKNLSKEQSLAETKKRHEAEVIKKKEEADAKRKAELKRRSEEFKERQRRMAQIDAQRAQVQWDLEQRRREEREREKHRQLEANRKAQRIALFKTLGIVRNRDVRSEDEFKSEVMSSEGLVLVDFYATWCPPCKELEPIMVQHERQFQSEFKLVKANADNLALKRALKFCEVTGLPTVVAFLNGDIIGSFEGLKSPSFVKRFIEECISLRDQNDEENYEEDDDDDDDDDDTIWG